MDAAPSAPHGPIWRGGTVLVVDDEPVVRQFLRRTLAGESVHVEEANDGWSALRLIQARAESFDLILTDLSMPEITADDLYHAVPDATSRATDPAAIAEAEIVRAHAGLSKLASALVASRTMRVQLRPSRRCP